jgi:DNA-binding transcriptional LysR family regulator
VEAAAEGAGGALRVGVFGGAGAQLLPRALARFQAAAPGVELTLEERDERGALLALLLRGELDLTFMVFPLPPGSPLEAVELLDDPYVAVTPPGWPEPLDLAGLAGLPLVAFRTHPVAELLRASGVEPAWLLRSDDNGTLLALVRAGLAVAFIPRLTTAGETGVRVAEVRGAPVRKVGLAWRNDRTRSAAASAFVRACRETLA